MRKARPLSKTKASHKAYSDHAMRSAERHLDAGMKAIKDGNCTRAYMHVTEMWDALGQSKAEGRRAGSTAWEPVTKIGELGYQFSTYCLRDKPEGLSGSRRRRRR
jgi:hypothetical protein